MLKVENVTKYYGNNLAVDDLSFTINNGEIFGLLGVNGAGKTTTFRMIMSLLEPTKGSITLNGKPVGYDVSERIGFLTEERSLLTKLTVKEQVIYYATLKGMKESDILKKLDYWLDRFGISDYKNRKIKELSKGNQQKIQFITAIIHEPDLLVLDEPFTGLDPINVELFMSVIREFKEKGKMIIFSSHRMEHVELFCEKLVILLKGKTVQYKGQKIKLGKATKVLGKAAVPLTVVTSAAEIGYAYKEGGAKAAAKQSVKSATGIAAGWAGAKIGAAIGTAICPGIGTAIGGFIGGIGGYLLGDKIADKVVG